MSKIKQIKSDHNNQINLAKVFDCFCENKSHKYLPFFLNILNKPTRSYNNEITDLKTYLQVEKNVYLSECEDLNVNEKNFLFDFISSERNIEKIRDIQNFIWHYENNRVKKEINKIETYDEMIDIMNVVDIHMVDKEMEKQVIKLFEDDEWVVVKPITWEASKKYGSNTKWCTASKESGRRPYFEEWASNGILIYVINKINGLKVAAHYRHDSKELTFWDQQDNRIDSLLSKLPFRILEIISNEITNNNEPNIKIMKSSKEEGIYPVSETERSGVIIHNQINNDLLVGNGPVEIFLDRAESPNVGERHYIMGARTINGLVRGNGGDDMVSESPMESSGSTEIGITNEASPNI